MDKLDCPKWTNWIVKNYIFTFNVGAFFVGTAIYIIFNCVLLGGQICPWSSGISDTGVGAFLTLVIFATGGISATG